MTEHEIRVIRSGQGVSRVEWDPGDGEPPVDLTPMLVLAVERTIDPNEGRPKVSVTFRARLVEVEQT
jgi:hypothetical protein